MARSTKPAAKPVAKKQAARKTAPAAKTARKAPVAKKVAVAAKTAVVAPTNKYDAAGTGRRMKGWQAPSTGPNRAIAGLQKIRDRSRDSVRNDWSAASTLQHWTTNLIGTGIVPRTVQIQDDAQREQIDALWADWCKVCDADGVLDFYGMQTLATRAWLESGECFVRMRPRRYESGLVVPLQIQLLEADMVPLLDADNWPGMVAGNKIRSGIELDRSGQRVAYWVYKEHPGDGSTQARSDQLVRVAKSQMLHVFEPKRIGQLRGVPDFAAVLPRLRNALDVDDAVIERYKIANLFAAFIKTGSLPGFDDGVDPVTGKQIEYEDDGDPMVGLEPGIVHKLLPGESMEFANPPEPGTVYPEFMRQQNVGVTAGAGMPYELASGDIREIQDRTLRIIINEFRRFAEQRQWQIIIPQMCQPVREYWVDTSYVAGVIASSLTNDSKRVLWSPQGWPYIHPTQDVDAKIKEVDAKFRSRDSVIGERGDDPYAVDKERVAIQKREKRLGLEPPSETAAQTAPPAQPSTNLADIQKQLQALHSAIQTLTES